jgi:hypothetical protein
LLFDFCCIPLLIYLLIPLASVSIYLPTNTSRGLTGSLALRMPFLASLTSLLHRPPGGGGGLQRRDLSSFAILRSALHWSKQKRCISPVLRTKMNCLHRHENWTFFSLVPSVLLIVLFVVLCFQIATYHFTFRLADFYKPLLALLSHSLQFNCDIAVSVLLHGVIHLYFSGVQIGIVWSQMDNFMSFRAYTVIKNITFLPIRQYNSILSLLNGILCFNSLTYRSLLSQCRAPLTKNVVVRDVINYEYVVCW